MSLESVRRCISSYYPTILKTTKTTIISDKVLSTPRFASIQEYRMKYPEHESHYSKFLDVRFLSDNLVSIIVRDYTHIRQIKYTCISPITSHEYSIQITYYLPRKKKSHWNPRVFALFEHYVKALFIMFFYLEEVHSPIIQKLKSAVHIHYCPTELPKRITRDTCQQKPFVFRPDSVNSGYATPEDGGYIVIYRYEEFNRLLFHECIHYLGIDGEESKWNEFVEVENEVRATHNVDGRIHLYESYTDTWAIYWNICIHMYFRQQSGFNTLWNNEIDHQVRIIEHSMYCIGNKSISEWMRRNTDSPSWKMEDTPTFDYYVLKHGAFRRGIQEIQKRFPFGKTNWNKQTVRAWFNFCQDGLRPYYKKYKPHNHESDKYVSTVMSNIGLKLS